MRKIKKSKKGMNGSVNRVLRFVEISKALQPDNGAGNEYAKVFCNTGDAEETMPEWERRHYIAMALLNKQYPTFPDQSAGAGNK